MEKIAIIGGGASALVCALNIKNKNVTVFEADDKFGKKILATGNGRCNLTNVNMTDYSYNVNVDKYLQRFSSQDAIAYFNNLGLETYADEEGRVYPISNTANSVLAVLKNKIELCENIKIETNKSVLDVIYENNRYKIVFFDKSIEYFDKVVMAMGNKANLKMFEKFSICYKNFMPSLCSLKTEKHKALAGVRVGNVKVICTNAHICFEEIGEVLFKDDGISGIVVFNLSAHMARCGNYCHKVVIDLLPNVSENELLKKLLTRRGILKEYLAEEFLTGFFHKQVGFELLKRSKIDLSKKTCQITNEEIEVLVKNIKRLEFNTCGHHENNQVASGGICLNELTCNLESKIQKGMYFIGEIVDVDGVCGGFNLQWAWTSGKIVGESL